MNEETQRNDRRRVTAFLSNVVQHFSTYFSEMMPVLADFCRLLELPNPELVVADPWLYFTPIAEWIDELEQHELPSIADRPWLVARLGYLIGELMVNRFSRLLVC